MLAKTQVVYQAQLGELFAGLSQAARQNLLETLAELEKRMR